jgi:hypothetical protein
MVLPITLVMKEEDVIQIILIVLTEEILDQQMETLELAAFQ